MAGDWIKMRVDLKDDPAVFMLADMLGVDEFSVVGRLHCFWAWADKHAVDGHVDGATTRIVDRVSATDGFAAAMQKVGWLVVDQSGISIPNFDRHNGESAKERGLKNARQARWRAGKSEAVDGQASTQSSTKPTTREEKRREEKKEETKAARKRAAPIPCPDDVSGVVWDDWLSLRKAKRAPVTETVLTEARAEAATAGMPLASFLRIWCARGSQGLQADWLKPQERQDFMSRKEAEAAKWMNPQSSKAGFDFIDMEASNAAPLAIR